MTATNLTFIPLQTISKTYFFQYRYSRMVLELIQTRV